MGREIDYSGKEREWEKQYSVWYYWWMKEYSSESDGVLERAIESNNKTWMAEHVFGVNYHEFELKITDGKLRSPDFGRKTLIEMCEDAVAIREKAGANLERAESEKMGVIKLEEMLGRMRIGETVVLISPPDPDDLKMGGYSMVYVYEKQNDGRVRAAAIREEKSSLQDLSVLANYLSGMSLWEKTTHLDFVTKPFATHLSFDQVVEEVGIRERDVLPRWVTEMSAGIVPAMLAELRRGRVEAVKEIFDAFQMAVKTRKEDVVTDDENGWIEPMQMITDARLWEMEQRRFLEVGGMEMIRAGGSCGRGDIGLRDNNIMSSLSGVKEEELEIEESYSFDHEGKCVVCKVEPKKLGPCGICKDCDKKIRQQAG